jgi:hypothetical protein
VEKVAKVLLAGEDDKKKSKNKRINNRAEDRRQ